MATYTTKSPDYPNCGPAYESTETRPGRGNRRIDVRSQALTVAELCACAGCREEVFEDGRLIWQSLNCQPDDQP